MVGGIDLSVGPLAGFVVVLASFILPSGASTALLAGGSLLLVGVCLAFGYARACCITTLRLPAIVVTLAFLHRPARASRCLLRAAAQGTISNTLSDVFGQLVLGVAGRDDLALGRGRPLRRPALSPRDRPAAAGGRIEPAGEPQARRPDGGDRVTRLGLHGGGRADRHRGLMLAGQIRIARGRTAWISA